MTFEPVSLPSTALSVLNVSALRAFHPAPDRGTLYGPNFEKGGSPNAASCRLITGGESAIGLNLFSILALVEAGEHWRLCSSQEREGPYRLPDPDQKGTPWFLDDYRKSHDRSAHGRAIFRTVDPVRIIEADLRSRPLYRYSFTIESPDAGFIQSIRVNERDHSVETDYFSAKIRSISLENGLKLALGLSTAVYVSGQYDARKNLGPLQFRQGELGSWSEVSRDKKRRFLAPHFDPDCHAELIFASSFSVFEDSAAPSPKPVVSLRLAPASERNWDLEVLLRRSPTCSSRLTPLSPRLRRLLWDPIFGRVFKR